MKSLPTRLSRLALAAVLTVSGAALAMAGQEAAVVTVGSNAKGEADSTLWAIALRYNPEIRNKKPSERTDADNAKITATYKALRDFHNTLANASGKGRIITDPNRLKVGEQLYLPSQGTVEALAKLQGADGNIPAAKFDQMMRTVLNDVAENKDVIQRSKSSSALTTDVLARAARVGDTDRRAEEELGQSSPTAAPSIIEEAMPNTELDDESAPTDGVVLDTDGAPTAVSQTASTTVGVTGLPNLPITLKEKTEGLEAVLPIVEEIANNPNNPNRDKAKALARKIKDELARRKREEEREAERQAAAAPSTPATTGTSAPQTASAAATTAASGTQVADAEDAQSGPIEIEYVPDWYLRALQEWNLQNYWQSKANKSKDAARGSKTYVDPLSGEVRKVDAGDDPFSEFSDQLTNYTRNQGQVEKREGP